MTERIYTVQLTYGQLQALIALVDNARHDIETHGGEGATERWGMLTDLTDVLLAAPAAVD